MIINYITEKLLGTSLVIIGIMSTFMIIYILFFRFLNRLLGGENPQLKDIINKYLRDAKSEKMEDLGVNKINLYKFYVDGKEKKFKEPLVVNIEPDEDYLIFSAERGDLMFHTVAYTIDKGLKNVLEILEEDWKQYALGELDSLSEGAIKYGEYLKSLVCL